jgi:hypothetical protein
MQRHSLSSEDCLPEPSLIPRTLFYVRLLVGCYRFKRFTDSCRRADNGKAPLELARVDIARRDWLSFLLDQ